MIDTTIYNYMVNSANLGASVYMERPEKPTKPFIVIEKTGENENNILRRSTIAIQCYDTTLYKSAVLCENVIGAMINGVVGLGSVASVKLNNSYNFTKTDSKEYRYQAVFEVYWYQQEE